MKRILNAREKIIFFATIGLIIFSLAFNFLAAPVLKKNDDLNKQIEFSQAKLKKYLWLLSQKEEILKRAGSSSIGQKTPQQQSDTVVSLLSELEDLAKIANIHIIDIRPEQIQGTRSNKKALIDLRAEGQMEGFLRYIYDLGNSFSTLKIEKLQISSKQNAEFLEGYFVISSLSTND